MGQTHPQVLAEARAAVDPLLDGDLDRILVGIAGPPAAGKSTMALSLVEALRREFGDGTAVAVPMDGFHLANAELDRLGLADRKGAPETFDAVGFVHLLRRLREADGELVYAPTFSRVVNESIGSAIPVGPKVRVVVVEGNYLLLPYEPWSHVRGLLDLVMYLEAPHPARIGSLLRRQQARGLGRQAAHDWVHHSDERNAALIEATRHRADVVLTRPD